MKTSDSIIEITKALGQFAKICPAIKKDTKAFNYMYTTLDTILSTVKPLLLKSGIVVVQSIGSNQYGMLITTRLMHISGEWLEDTMMLPATELKGGNNVQMMGASITYGKRYGLSAMLGISTEDDTDGVVKTNNNNNQRGKNNARL